MTTETEKFQACHRMLKTTLAGYVPAKPALFNPYPRDADQVALYAAACGLAEAAIAFAVLSDGAHFDDEVIREQARDPQWVAKQDRETLAAMFKVVEDEDRFDDGR